jgi:DNA repair exonuclease SbcCD ATPase subunit
MIKFDNIIIEGFGSLDRFSYSFTKRGINVILGVNGVGKTTIFSALTWVLFKELLKSDGSVKPWPEVIQFGDYRGTMVNLTFHNEHHTFEVIRCLDYTPKLIDKIKGKDRLLLIQDGVIRNDLRDKKDIQKEIEKIIGYSFKLFKNSIVFGQNLARIIKETGPNKKAIFDEAFEVEFINLAKKNSEKEREIKNIELVPLKNKYEILRNKFISVKEKRDREKELRDNFESERDKKILDINIEIGNQSKDLNSAKDGLKNLPAFEGALEEHKKTLASFQEHLNTHKQNSDDAFKLGISYTSLKGQIRDESLKLEKIIDKWKGIIKNCPRCSKPLDKQDIKKERDKLEKEGKIQRKVVKDLNIQLEANGKVLNELDLKISSLKQYKDQEFSLNTNIKRLEKTITDLKVITNTIPHIEKQLKRLKEQKTQLIEEKPQFLDKKHSKEIKALLSEIKPLRLEIKELKKQIKIIDWLIDDPLSNKGLKAYVFDTMLHFVNENLEKYSNHLGYRIKFDIDLDSARKDFSTSITRKGYEKFYGELSGGQQQLVDVAIAFAIHDTVSMNKACNILIMDEIFESLSADNIEIVIDLIKIKAKELSIHLVTHRTEFSLRTSKIIHLTLKNGITTLV